MVIGKQWDVPESVYLGARKQEAREGAHMIQHSFQEPNLLSVKQKDSDGWAHTLKPHCLSATKPPHL